MRACVGQLALRSRQHALMPTGRSLANAQSHLQLTANSSNNNATHTNTWIATTRADAVGAAVRTFSTAPSSASASTVPTTSAPSSAPSTATATAAAAAPSTSSPTPPPPPPSDDGAPFELAEDESEKPSSWRRNITLLLLAGGITYHLYSQRKEFTEHMNRDVISCIPSEIHDLINVFHFTTKDLESLYAKTMQRCPRGEISLEDFSVLLGDQVSIVRARRSKQRSDRSIQRSQEEWQQDKAEVILERRIERAQKGITQEDVAALQAEHAALVASHVIAESHREKAAQADQDEALADTHKDNAYVPIDTYVFFRTTRPRSLRWVPRSLSPEKVLMMDVRDLFLGFSNVIFDHVELEQRLEERKDGKNIPTNLKELKSTWSARDIEVFTRLPSSKLHFAWRVTDQDRDGQLTLKEIETMLGRLIRTGHALPESLRRRVMPNETMTGEDGVERRAAASPLVFLPYNYRQSTPKEISEEYWREIAHHRRRAAWSKRDAMLSSNPSTPLSSLPDVSTPAYSDDLKVTWSEFLHASETFTQACHNGPIAYWYLNETYPNGTSIGTMAKWRHRRTYGWEKVWKNIPTPNESKQIDSTIQTFLV